jgi:uncharacterized protein
MTAVYADTWFFQAMLSAQDAHHAEVLAYLDAHDDFVVTTRWVLTEVANAAGGSAFRHQAARFLESAENDPNLMIVGGSDDLYLRGLRLYGERLDKQWSLTDCISFVVMQEHGITDALTGDRHFEQAGFKAVFAV